jgi:hypothetical protein
MVVTPGLTGVTTPVVAPIVATPVADEDHEPPPASVSVVVEPIHTVPAPEIGEGVAVTESTMDVVQPEAAVKVIIVVPTLSVVTTPVVGSMVATPVVPEAQLPDDVSESVAVVPTHTTEGPVMTPGAGLTVTTLVAVQPEPSV